MPLTSGVRAQERLLFFSLFIPSALFPSLVSADTAILDHIVQQFENSTATWFANLLPIANRLFMTLAAIELVVSGMWWALESDSLPSVFVAFLKRIVALSFFFMLLLNAPVWIPALIDSFLLAGQVAGGASGLSPSAVMGQGIDLAGNLFSGLKGQGWVLNPAGSLIAVFCAATVTLAFALIAAQFVVLLVEIYVVIGGGVLLLGFAASRFSIGFSEKYIGYAFATGVKAFVLMLIVGVGSGLVSGWQDTIASAELEDAFAILAASIVYVAVAWQVPAFAGAMIGGMPALSLGSVVAPLTRTAATGAVIAGAGAASVGAAVRGAATLAAAASFATASARASGGGFLSGASQGAGALVGEGRRTMGNRLRSTFFSPTAQRIQQRRALLVGQALPPPRRSVSASEK